jgi:hypothetical protein
MSLLLGAREQRRRQQQQRERGGERVIPQTKLELKQVAIENIVVKQTQIHARIDFILSLLVV